MDDIVKRKNGESLIEYSPNEFPLPENDRIAVIGIISQFHKCRTRRQLKAVFQSNILPILGAQSALYAWTASELCNAQLIDCVNIPKKEIPAIKEFVCQNPKAKSVLSHPFPVIARDVVLPPGQIKNNGVDAFFKKRPKKEGFDYFDLSHPGRITIAIREPSFCAGIHRRYPCDKPWTIREIRILEQIRPHLLQTLRNILLSEEVESNKSLIATLADVPDAIALINQKQMISFCNRTFEELFSVKLGGSLSVKLKDLLQKKLLKNKSGKGLHTIEVPEYEISHDHYRIKLIRLRGGKTEENGNWLLRLSRVEKSPMKSCSILDSAGLTGRETEICDLAREGFDDREIAGQLFISPHTVKAHLKKIHEKLEVHTRAQLIATLNR